VSKTTKGSDEQLNINRFNYLIISVVITTFSHNSLKFMSTVVARMLQTALDKFPDTTFSSAFSDIPKNKLNRRDAALAFAEILLLCSLDAIKVKQKKPYSDLVISTSNHWGLL
jgi:hypothetical protein